MNRWNRKIIKLVANANGEGPLRLSFNPDVIALGVDGKPFWTTLDKKHMLKPYLVLLSKEYYLNDTI